MDVFCRYGFKFSVGGRKFFIIEAVSTVFNYKLIICNEIENYIIYFIIN